MANRAQHQGETFNVGDTVKVHQKIIEGGKERIQIFAGMVIAIRGMGDNKSFTVRRISSGNVGVERIWPLLSPWILKLEIVKRGKVRRAKLYYLRKRVGKQAARVRSQQGKVTRVTSAKKTPSLKSAKSDKTKPRSPRRAARQPASQK